MGCFKCMGITAKHVSFMGRSSNLSLIKTALSMKHEMLGKQNSGIGDSVAEAAAVISSRRPEFWECVTVGRRASDHYLR